MPNIHDLTLRAPMSMVVLDPLGEMPADVRRLLAGAPASLIQIGIEPTDFEIDLLDGLSPAVVADILAGAAQHKE